MVESSFIEPRPATPPQRLDAGSAPVAGAAAILGFLYQVLGTSARVIQAAIDPSSDDQPPSTITAVLEPTSGGDLQLAAALRTCVQFKYRSSPLGTTDLAGALVDLFRAHCSATCDIYELQCSGPITKPAARLIERLAGTTAQRPGVEQALQKVRLRCQAIFMEAQLPASGFDDSFDCFASRFRLGQPLDAEGLITWLEAWLAAQVAYANRASAKLDQMIGALIRRSANNDAVMASDELFDLLGLTPKGPGEPRRCLSAALAATLAARHFEVAEDVREPRLPTAEQPITLIVGQSGRGKTFSLCRLAFELDARGDAALLLSAPDLARLEALMVRTVALEALGLEDPVQAAALARPWRRRLGRDDANIWVLWEGCRDVAELAALQLAGGIGHGIKLVAELPPGTSIDQGPLKDIPVRHVGDFSEGEMFEALRRRGLPAGRIPQPIRRMLRVPVLCGLYASLATETAGWLPTNEYLVLERFWERAAQRAGPLAAAALKGIARRMVDRRRARLSDSEIAELGFADTLLGNLTSAGWVERVDEHWRFAHDRLLTWAIAEALAESFADEVIEPIQLAAIQHDLSRSHDDRAKLQELGFLLMDLTWLVIRRKAGTTRIAELFAAFEAERDTGSRVFYRELLHTAGQVIIPSLMARLQLAGDGPPEGLAGDVMESLREMPGHGVARVEVISALIGCEAPAARSILLLLGAHWPLPDQLDGLWKEYGDVHQDVAHEAIDFQRSQMLDAAILRAVAAKPDWLRAKIDDCTDPEQLWFALFFLKSVPAVIGRPIWEACSEKMIGALNAKRRAALAECIGRFSDGAKCDFLVASLSDRHAASSALEALCRIDPVQALAKLDCYPPDALPPARRVWLDRMLDADPIGARDKLRTWALNHDATGGSLARLWLRAIDRIDVVTIETMLALLDDHVSRDWAEGRASDDLLAILGHLELDPAYDGLFARWRHTRLAIRLAKRAKATPKGGRDEVVAARRLLRRIGGPHYEKLVLNRLNRPLSKCLGGIRWAPFAPTPAVLTRLGELSDDWVSPCEDELRIELWRTLWGLDPATWEPRVLALLAETDPFRVHLGLSVIRESWRYDMCDALMACVERSEPGSRTEALAMGLAIQMGDAPSLFERGVARFLLKNDDEEGRVAAFNVMLRDERPESRALLDDFLLEAAAQKSISSTVLNVLSIRLRQDDVGDRLYAAGEKYMRGHAFFGEDIIEAYLERAPDVAKDYLLGRAFAVPDVFTSAQPDAIRTLAKLDRPLAEEAYVQSWTLHPERRQYLAPVARTLGDAIVESMVKGLASDGEARDSKFAFREACLELRRRADVAEPLLRAAILEATPEEREIYCEAIGWMPAPGDLLRQIEADDPEPDVREKAYQVRLAAERRKAAMDAFAANPDSLEAMEYAIDLNDPRIMLDHAVVIELIRRNSRLALFAETQFARRFNEVSSSRYKRARIRPRE